VAPSTGLFQKPPYNFDTYSNFLFLSDYSIAYQGWTLKGFKVKCERSNMGAGAGSNVSRLHANGQRDGVLLGTGDIVYLSTVQEANKELLLILRPDNPNSPTHHADYDLYASTNPNTTPGPGGAMWASLRALQTDAAGVAQMLDDFILIPPVGYARYIFIGVYAYQEDQTYTGGFRLYDNTIGKKFTIRVGTSFDYRNGPFGDVTNKLVSHLKALTGGLHQTDDGTGLVTEWQLWNNPSGEMCNGQLCPLLFVSPAAPVCIDNAAFCASAPGTSPDCNFGNNARIIDCNWNGVDSASFADLEAHEFGHCMYKVGNDEYVGAGYRCGHSLMTLSYNQTNGTFAWTNFVDHCTGNSSFACQVPPPYPPGNHGTDCFNQSGVSTNATSGWSRMKSCFPDQFQYYSPTGYPATPDPEKFSRSDIWNSLATVTFMN
jgi:hypothetical protein